MSDFPETLSRDQGRLRHLQAACRRNPADPKAQASLTAALAESRAAFSARAAARPEPRVDDSLPVLRSARQYGIAHLCAVYRPDTRLPEKDVGEFAAIRRFSEITPKPAQ